MSGTRFGFVTPDDLAVFTDLYELAMIQGFLEADHTPLAAFSLFFRGLPDDRGYAVAAGLEQAIHYLESIAFDDAALTYLAEIGFDETLLAYLDGFEFTGEVRAVPEGTPVFPNEPLLEVTAPVTEAQLFETLLLNQIGYQTLIATKAARMRDVVDRRGDGQTLVDFGSRRGHGTDAGMKAARAAVIGGFAGTSNVVAGRTFDLDVYGTMAHSWVQSFPSERAAFEAFVDVYGGETVLLVDTYDTIEGVRTAIEVADAAGVDLRGVRLDSGDLVELSNRAAALLDDTEVFVSSGMDEYAIDEFLAAGGHATGFGPGTALVTSPDAPTLDMVYKLVAVERDGALRPSMKLSQGKVTYPGRKRVTRTADRGTFAGDTVARRGEAVPGEDLLVPVFEDGSLVYDPPDLAAIRERTLDQVGRLPEAVRALRDPVTYPVEVSDGLAAVTEDLRAELSRG